MNATRKLITAGLAATVLFAGSQALAQRIPEWNGNGTTAQTLTAFLQATYQLLGTRGGAGFVTQNGTGTPVGPAYGGTYIERIQGTFSGCTASTQVLDADGVTWLTVATATANSTSQITIGASPPYMSNGQINNTPNVRIQLTGCTAAPSLWANLS